jgi:hypothetical protein
MRGGQNHWVQKGMTRFFLDVIQKRFHVLSGQDQRLPKFRDFMFRQPATGDPGFDFRKCLKGRFFTPLGIF